MLAGYGAGSLPFSNWAAGAKAGVDLRRVGTGTVSGTGLGLVAGPGAVVVVGLFEVAKGAVGPALAGGGHPLAQALAGAAGVVGHDWSIWLKGAGGRGISPALGALAVTAPVGSLALLGGLALGRLSGQTALGCLGAYGLLVPLCWRYHGRPGALAAAAVVAPMLTKRLMGNQPPSERKASVYLYRLLYDRDGRGPVRADGPKDSP